MNSPVKLIPKKNPLLVTSLSRTRTGEAATSYWVGQFSPAVTSAADVKMIASPQSRAGVSTEGTPPYTLPAPAKFISGTQLSKGEYDFKLTNMRDTTNWVLFAGSLTSAAGFEVVGVSEAVTFSDADQPSHLRLARTSSTNEMRVSWTSSAKTASTPMAVQWGTDPAALTKPKVMGVASTYAATDLCGMPANNSGFHHPGVFFTAVLPLGSDSAAAKTTAAGLVYYYRVGSDAFGWSAVESFKAPQPVNPQTPMTIVVTADMGKTPQPLRCSLARENWWGSPTPLEGGSAHPISVLSVR